MSAQEKGFSMIPKIGTMKKTIQRLLLAAVVGGSALLSAPENAAAEQIRVTGPLAGAPAVRNLRLYRKLRLEVSPTLSFTLLDQYRRQIFAGARLNYGITDWLAVGVWGGVSSSMVGLDLDTDLSRRIQGVNEERNCNVERTELNCKLTAVNLGDDFSNQISSMNWIAAPQVTAVPFRGKLGLFNDIFVDADLYAFGGVGFIGLDERPNCDVCTDEATFQATSRMAIAPTFGLGFTFYTGRWTALGAEWRGLPFKSNNGGFDVAGEGNGDESEFPDGIITKDDREFHFNQMLSISFNMYFPQQHRVSE